MTIAIMQPYLFPYIGYFQMIQTVDKFVFYDDVNFIKQGWINRNNILLNEKAFRFTVPLEKASSFTPINETQINKKQIEKWKDKFLQTLSQGYKKAPFYKEAIQPIEAVLNQQYDTISELAIESCRMVSEYLGLETEFIIASEAYDNKELKRGERIKAICKKENASHYINAPGGMDLYDKDDFLKDNIQLNFIKSKPISYEQFNNDFVPWLSIIDVLMFNSVAEVNEMLDKYELM